jgi:hypothetical protein
MKLVATIVSYSSGNAGGIFAPTLYIGAYFGGEDVERLSGRAVIFRMGER